MLVDFKSLPGHSKVWIYQSSRAFTETEMEELNQHLTSFLQQWKAHDQDLVCAYEIKYQRFIIIAADQEKHIPSGCSIDTQVHLIQKLEKAYKIVLLDRMNVSFRQGDFIVYKELSEFKTLVKNRSVTAKTIVFNNVVNNLEEYNGHWEVPALDSWHRRFFK